MTLPPRPANRLFAAADLPADVRARLAGSAAEVAARSGGRPVAPESLHVTLDFIGRVEPSRWPALAEARRRGAHRTAGAGAASAPCGRARGPRAPGSWRGS